MKATEIFKVICMVIYKVTKSLMPSIVLITVFAVGGIPPNLFTSGLLALGATGGIMLEFGVNVN